MSTAAPQQSVADRNLVLGVLALQMEFVTGEALIQALNVWVRDKARPLADVLAESGGLGGDRRAVLEELVDLHLRAHGGDAEECLAWLSGWPKTLDVERIADSKLQSTLQIFRSSTAPVETASAPSYPDTLPEPSDPEPSDRTASTESFPDTLPETPGRDACSIPVPETRVRQTTWFRLLRFHDEGGLGRVWVAHDETLGREVAFKEIKEQRAADLRSRERFLLEAQATGALEHPGIVPVYGLGAYPDGRPFYAMRFIRGENLHDALVRFHKADQEQRDPGERSLELRHLLSRFIDVCNALAYAHSRGVLHRDLKPSNIMLGPYGETLVVDWGLAKPLGRINEAPDPSAGPLPFNLPGDSTRGPIGTPAYMSPEQAAGQIDQLSPASDVYSLGATLYHLLTGKTPFTGDPTSVMQQAQRGEFPPPRQVKSGVPVALEAVCLKAMRRKPEDRYLSAKALAEDIERWLADEPVSAYAEPWTVRARRWARRRRSLVTGAAAATLVAVIGLALFAWVRYDERRILREQVADGLEDAAAACHRADWNAADDLLKNLSRQLGDDGPPDLRQALQRQRKDLMTAQELEKIRMQIFTPTIDDKGELVVDRTGAIGPEGEYARAFRRYWDEPGFDFAPAEAATVAARIDRSAIREPLVLALQDWMVWEQDEEIKRWLVAVVHRADPAPWRQKILEFVRQDDVKEIAEFLRKDADALPVAAPLYAGPLLMREGFFEESADLAQVFLPYYPDNALLLVFAALGAEVSARSEEAVEYYRASLALRPDSPIFHNGLGVYLGNLERYTEAVEELRRAIELAPTYREPYFNLGWTFQRAGDLKAAEQQYHATLEKFPDYAMAYFRLGDIYRLRGQLRQAEEAYRRASELDPSLPEAWNNLGGVRLERKQWSQAAADFRKAMELDPNAAEPHFNLGWALTELGSFDEAEREYRKAVEVDPDHALAHSQFGRFLIKRGRLAEAVEQFRAAVEIQRDDLESWLELGTVLLNLERYEDAQEALETVADAWPEDDWRLLRMVGILLLKQGKFEDARGVLSSALEKTPWLAPERNEIQHFLERSERWLDLEPQLEAVLSGGEWPEDPIALYDLAHLCDLRGQRPVTAARFYRAALNADASEAPAVIEDRLAPAVSAITAATGDNAESRSLSAEEREQWRKQALQWLRADLEAWEASINQKPGLLARVFGSSPPGKDQAAQYVRTLLSTPRLEPVRNRDALNQLPADEREAWESLWQDARRLLDQAMTPDAASRQDAAPQENHAGEG